MSVTVVTLATLKADIGRKGGNCRHYGGARYACVSLPLRMKNGKKSDDFNACYICDGCCGPPRRSICNGCVADGVEVASASATQEETEMENVAAHVRVVWLSEKGAPALESD